MLGRVIIYEWLGKEIKESLILLKLSHPKQEIQLLYSNCTKYTAG